MQIYIDESGCFGSRGRYFLIACLVPPTTNRLKNLVKSCRLSFGTTDPATGKKLALAELKGSKLTFDERQHFVNRLMSAGDFKYAYIVADKNHTHPQLLSRQSICFNYLTTLLLEPVVRAATENIEVVCDNRNIAVEAGKSLEEYIQAKAYGEWGFGHEIKLGYADSIAHNHLQCVDVISNTLFGKYSLNKEHFYKQMEPQKMHGIRFPQSKFGT